MTTPNGSELRILVHAPTAGAARVCVNAEAVVAMLDARDVAADANTIAIAGSQCEGGRYVRA
ncbi:hypothetical protein [Ottowia thiooxydans]|uniref:hypothetical protein n=1 Tax=Ottowia thiooxydans TaxID=219182 RepID=UPI0003F9D146|nr:hypothetical protein [Ottowia thiooxydans]